MIISDVNECDHGTALCNQRCKNTVGNYSCYCNSGYRLLEDGFTCIGMLDDTCMYVCSSMYCNSTVC